VIPLAEQPIRPGDDVEFSLFNEGDMVDGRYRIVRFIARGGMGLVYEVLDVHLEEALALKALKPEVARQSGNLKRFHREILLARKVTHPNVCRIYDAGLHQGRSGYEIYFLTMELLHGETLENLLAAPEPLPRFLVRSIACQIARGLRAAHGVGVVHRDLKCGNVLLERSEDGEIRAVITDFGLARSLEPDAGQGTKLTATGQLMGTPAYFAPELLEGKALTPASDVYSLGVMVYEMVTGQQPFRGRTPFLTALKRLKEEPVDPRAHVPDLEPEWVEVILRCLERDPEKRPTTREFIEWLMGNQRPATEDLVHVGRSWLRPGEATDPSRLELPESDAVEVDHDDDGVTSFGSSRWPWIAGAVLLALLVLVLFLRFF
jgi:serine/threonine protein kinase